MRIGERLALARRCFYAINPAGAKGTWPLTSKRMEVVAIVWI